MRNKCCNSKKKLELWQYTIVFDLNESIINA